MDKRHILISARLVAGGLVFTAITVQVIHLLLAGAFNPFNFFSYFTILSNIFAASVLLFGALYLVKHRLPSPKEDLVRGASVLYMSVTGVVYMTLLSKYHVGLSLDWVNYVLHYIMPVVVVLDWLYQPPRAKLVVKQVATWVIFPLMYLVYTLLRGPFVDWYPYPFLNPALAGGYGGVIVYSVGILIAMFVLGWLLMKLGNLLKRQVG